MSIMSLQDKQCRRICLLCFYTVIFLFYYLYWILMFIGTPCISMTRGGRGGRVIFKSKGNKFYNRFQILENRIVESSQFLQFSLFSVILVWALRKQWQLMFLFSSSPSLAPRIQSGLTTRADQVPDTII